MAIMTSATFEERDRGDSYSAAVRYGTEVSILTVG